MKLFTLHSLLLLSLLGPSTALTWQESLIQNDLLAAMSWALFDIDPYSFLRQDNETEQARLENNEIDHIDGPRNEELIQGRSLTPLHAPVPAEAAAPAPQFGGNAVQPFRRMKRQMIPPLGMAGRLRIEIRMLKIKLFEVYDTTSFIMFLGVGVTTYLDDIFAIKGRNRESNFLYALEDLISLIGVDGPACVHRLMCDLGSAPVFQINGLFGELVDLTVRHILKREYSDISSNVIDSSAPSGDREARDNHSFSSLSSQNHNTTKNNSKSSSSDNNFSSSSPEKDEHDSSPIVSYLDAVAAGRHGANCAHTFPKCPVSLFSMLKYINDQN